ncbi:MAG: prevent-host-death protein [Acidobacteria bacterium]|nr:MAG: prevent-host-death protein [Acidobacteriota bacterium]
MARVGIRELKNRLSKYLQRVEAGERLVVTERGRPVAFVIPAGTDEHVEMLLREQVVHWGGSKPKGARKPPKVDARQSVAGAVLRDRS